MSQKATFDAEKVNTTFDAHINQIGKYLSASSSPWVFILYVHGQSSRERNSMESKSIIKGSLWYF